MGLCRDGLARPLSWFGRWSALCGNDSGQVSNWSGKSSVLTCWGGFSFFGVVLCGGFVCEPT
jgi:hypothetical protein